jgi:hypothetical protein
MSSTAKGRRKEREQDAIEQLQGWCKWARTSKLAEGWHVELAKNIEDVISQVGTWKAKYERAIKKD